MVINYHFTILNNSTNFYRLADKNMKNQLIFKNIKISFLKDDIIRIENCPDFRFSDQESINIAHKRVDLTDYKSEINGDEYKIFYKDLVVVFNSKDILNSFQILKDDEIVYKYKFVKTSGELPAVEKTPFIFPVMDYPRILVGDLGYDPDSDKFVVEKDTKDLFLLVARKDFKQLRKQYISLTGNNEMPRLKNFGLWSSRYYPYSDKQILDVIAKYSQNKIPLDNFVVDTDWRLADGSYETNKKYFPDMESFIVSAHKKGVELLFNDHPVDTDKERDLLDKEEIEYRTKNLTDFFKIGLDSWWYDRNWIVTLKSPTKRVKVETLVNYAYFSITKNFYQSLVLDQEVYIRPTFMSNVPEIVSGNYQGIADHRNHTYAFQWSGDISSDLSSLNNEIDNMLRCSKNMIAYYSSDIGGFTGNPNRNDFVRWYQYGALSPMLRPHCSNTVMKSREPWVYDKKTTDLVKEYIDLRYRLLNVFYTQAFKHYSDGLGITRPISFVFPNDRKVNKNKNAYMLGDNILVAPISAAPKVELSKRDYVEKVVAKFYKGEGFKRDEIKTIEYDTLGFDLDDKQIARGVPKAFSARFTTKVKFNENVNLHLHVSGGVKVFIDNALVVNKFAEDGYYNDVIKELRHNHTYKIKVEYCKCTKTKAYLHLYYTKDVPYKNTKIYLPEGEWFDVFHRGVYLGNRIFKKKYNLEEVPMLVRGGALIPLYKNVNNISKMSLKEIVYDYYPTKNRVVKDFFYEDDGTTTAYKVGVYRENNYETYFSKDENCYVVKFAKSLNQIDDDISFRKAFLKMHVLDGEFIEKATINGQNVKITRHDHKKDAFPFASKDFASDSKTAVVKFRQNIKEDYEIKLFVRK